MSLVASGRLKGSHDDHTVEIPHSAERLLRMGVVYGANGAGKSNVCRALAYLRALVTGQGLEEGEGMGRAPFALKLPLEPETQLELVFVAEGMVLQYGVVVTDERVAEEWLCEVRGNREVPIYERTTSAEGVTTVEGKGLKASGEKVEMAAKIGGRGHRTFLATLGEVLDARDIGGAVGVARRWFAEDLLILSPDSSWMMKAQLLRRDAGMRHFLSGLLERADTGVAALEVQRQKLGRMELEQMFGGPEGWRMAAENLRRGIVIVNRLGQEIYEEHGEYFVQDLYAVHKGREGQPFGLPLEMESDGTRRLLDLGPALQKLCEQPLTVVVDELERSLHPNLVRRFLEIFLEAGKGQLLVTTHESRLLDLELLRRDEIWFAEKSEEGATKLYSLAEFHVRKDLRVDTGYLLGRFGAVPKLPAVEEFLPEAP